MYKFASLGLLLSFILGTFPLVSAQESHRKDVSARFAPGARFESTRALTDGEGVLVRWQMGAEKSVAAYRVYRIGPEGSSLVTTSLIPGSAARFGATSAYGEVYHFFDAAGEAGFVYKIEGVLTNGSQFFSKELKADRVVSLESEVGTPSRTYLAASQSVNSSIEQRTSNLDSELQHLVSRYEQEPDPVNQNAVAGIAGAKIGVKRDGFYRVTSEELRSANFPVNSDSAKWRLFLNGNEQAIIVGPDSRYVEFYGKSIDAAETDTRIYYLIADSVPGKRISSKVLRQIPGSAISQRYTVTAEKKERVNFANRTFNGEDENYLGSLFSDQPARINFSLTGIDYSVPLATIKLRLFGLTLGHHEVRPRLNGNLLPLMLQYDRVYYSETFTVPTSQLLEGTNELELSSSRSADFNLFDKLEVKYERKYHADHNTVSFSAPAFKKVDLSGFSTPNVRVFDLTFDGNPARIGNVAIEPTGSGYTAKLPSGRSMIGYAFEDSALRQAASITENLPSSLSASSNGAEMLIISHDDSGFLNAAETWANYRRSSAGGNLSVKIVNVTDIYDEFSYGLKGYKGVKAFLNHTSRQWATSPRYVLLLGDSTYDPKNYEGFGNFDLIPSQSVSLILEESVSDEALGDFDNDGLSDIAIGRIPARTAAQVDTVFNKTVRYEAVQQSFDRGVLFAHDNPIGFDFENMSIQLSQLLPQNTMFSMVHAGAPDASASVIEQMNTGRFLVNYSGHGAAGIWASSGFFQNNSVTQLTNINNPTLFSMLTCLNGYFIRPNADSLSETLLFSRSGGAAGVWSSTSETTPDIQLIMATRFFNEMSTGNLERMGDLVKDAKMGIDAGADVRLSWALLGDPAMRVP